MEHLDKMYIHYGSVKTLDGKIITVGGNVGSIRDSLKEDMESKCELVKVFGISQKGTGRSHAIVLEGYIYNLLNRGDQFWFVGGTSYNKGCRKPVNHRWANLRHPSARITCSRCLTKIQQGRV